MSAASPVEAPPSLLGITIRRATILGRFFLVYGTVLSTLLAALLTVSAGAGFVSGFPLFLPVFGAVGSMGGLTVFSNDRMKGALEYFLAYGLSPQRLFTNVLVTALVLGTIIVGVSSTVGVGVYLARGHPLNGTLALSLGGYGIPMTYASAAFATIVGMYWTALSSPRSGLNSPIGLAPLIGVLPPVSVLTTLSLLASAGTVTSAEVTEIALLAVLGVAAVTVALLALSGRLLRSERLLSPT